MRAVVIMLLLLSLGVAVCARDVTVKVFVYGKLQSYTPPARIHNGVTYVPLRQGARSLGCSVEWLPQEHAAKVCTAHGCVLIRASEGLIVNGSLFLPLRKMSEAFGCKVVWDARDKAVIITKK